MPRLHTFAPALLLAGCVAGADTSTTGQSIVGGVTDTGDPAVVIVDLGNGLCTGTVISPHVILTAGHCIEQVNNTSIRFENEYGDNTGPTIQATEVLRHPEYNSGGKDIGLVAIGTAAPTTPIPFNTTALESHIGEAVRIVGFGVTSENGNDSGLKRQGDATLFALLTENGGEVETTNQPQGTCYGDSGGPNFMTIGGHEVVAGITTTGTDICGSGYDIGTRVDAFADWIQTFVSAHDSATCGADGQCDNSCPNDPDCTVDTPPDAGPTDNGPDAGDSSADGGDDGNPANGDGTGCCQTGGGGEMSTLVLVFGVIAVGFRRRR